MRVACDGAGSNSVRASWALVDVSHVIHARRGRDAESLAKLRVRRYRESAMNCIRCGTLHASFVIPQGTKNGQRYALALTPASLCSQCEQYIVLSSGLIPIPTAIGLASGLVGTGSYPHALSLDTSEPSVSTKLQPPSSLMPASCLMPGCFSSASAFAVDNRARFKHVCRFCYADMRPEEREHYALENRIK